MANDIKHNSMALTFWNALDKTKTTLSPRLLFQSCYGAFGTAISFFFGLYAKLVRNGVDFGKDWLSLLGLQAALALKMNPTTLRTVELVQPTRFLLSLSKLASFITGNGVLEILESFEIEDSTMFTSTLSRDIIRT